MSALQDLRQLRAAVMRAALADDRDSAERLREEGARLAVVLDALVRQCRPGAEGPTRAATQELLPVLGRLVEALGLVQLEPGAAGLEMNGLLLRFRPEEQATAQQLSQELLRHQVAGLQIHAPLDEAQALLLGQALAGPAGGAATALGQRLEAVAPLRVLARPAEAGPAPPALEPWLLAREHLRVAYTALAADRLPDLAALRGTAALLALETAARPDRALGVTLWPWQMGPGEHVLLAATTLGLRLGQCLGLGPAALEDLALASLLQAARPPAAALRRLASPRGAHAGKLRRLLPLLELAAPAEAGATHLLSRLLRIARDYALLVVERPAQPRLAPPMAQALMWAARGQAYDPDLLALFVQQTGLYPPGSLVELSDGRAAVVLSGGRDAERFAWPRVAIVRGTEPGPAAARLDLYEERERLRPKRVLAPGSVPFDLPALWSE